MVSLCIDPEARRFLEGLPSEERQHVRDDLADLELAVREPSCSVLDLALPVPDLPGVYRSRVGRGGRWYAYWRLNLPDPRPLHWVHVLLLEEAPPGLVL